MRIMRCGGGGEAKGKGCLRTLSHPSERTKETGLCHHCRTGGTQGMAHSNRRRREIQEFAVGTM